MTTGIGTLASPKGVIDEELARIEGLHAGAVLAIAAFALVALAPYSLIAGLAISAWALSAFLLQPLHIRGLRRKRLFVVPAIGGFLLVGAMLALVAAWAFLGVGQRGC